MADSVPEQLKVYVSQDIWNMWSPIRRNSFTQILKNPNTFFYRNRPPGDPQKTGPFTEEEEQQFLDRLHYFRDVLKIDDGMWGLFSVPIRGRLGYQCANFYRSLILQGRIHDDHYEVVDGKLNYSHKAKVKIDDSVMKILTQEAFAFIDTCLKTDENQEAPKMMRPVRVAAPPRTESRRRSDDKDDDDLVNTANVPTYSQFQRRRAFFNEAENNSPLCGALDPITKKPIKIPMMDADGYVMDLTSWRQFLKGNERCPFPTNLTAEHELIQITASNYSKFKAIIVNIPC